MVDPPPPEPKPEPDPVDAILSQLGNLLKGNRDNFAAVQKKLAEVEAANAKLNTDLRKTVGDKLKEWLEEDA